LNFIEKIRQQLGFRKLKSEIEVNRKPRACAFSDANSVAILYKEKGESFYVLVKQYMKYLKEEHGIRKVLAIAYVEEKEIPQYQQHKLEFDYFTRKDLNWHFKPNNVQLKNFSGEDFDILLDFDLENCLPIRYILAQSKAKMKVGVLKKENEAFYDLMIQYKTDYTFDDFIKQINFYLINLTKRNAERA
jgi:hypothetical protein